MAILRIVGFEEGYIEAVSSAFGTASVVSSGQKTGSYALRVNPTTTGFGGVSLGKPAATGRITENIYAASSLIVGFAFKAVTLPASNYEMFLSFGNGAGADIWDLCVSSAGILTIRDSTTHAVIATGTAVIGSTYRYIEVKITANSASGAYEVRVDGVTDMSGTTNTTAHAQVSEVLFAKFDINGNSVDFYYDDAYVDSNTFRLSGSSWPEVKGIFPNAAGNAAGWTNGTGSTFAEVDEVPHDGDTTYIQASATQDNLRSTFNLESTATKGITGTVLAVQPYVYAKTGSTSLTSAVGITARNGSTDVDSTGSELVTTYWPYALVLTTDPNGGGSWTLGGVDTLEVGMFSGTINQTQRFTQAMASVLYLPPVVHSAAAALAVAVTLAAAATNTKVAAAVLATAVTLSPVAKLTAGGAAALSVAVTVAPAAKITASGAAVLPAIVTVSPAAKVTYAAAAGLSASVTLVGAGGTLVAGSAAVSMAVTLSAVAIRYAGSFAALNVVVTVSPAGVASYAAQSAVGGVVSVAPAGTVTLGAASVLATAVTLAAAATNIKVAQAALNVAVSVVALGSLTQFGVAALAMSASVSTAAYVTLGGASVLAVVVTVTPAPKATLAGTVALFAVVTLAANGGLRQVGAIALTVTATLSAIGSLRTIPNEYRTWGLLYDGSNIVTSFIPYIITGRTYEGVNKVGTFEVKIPANQTLADLLVYGRRLDLCYEPEMPNPIFRGRIRDYSLSDKDAPNFTIRGWSLGVELIWGNTGYAIYANADTASNVMSNVVARAETTWTRLISGSGYVTFTNDFPPMNLWRASLFTAQTQSAYIRETTTARQIEMKRGTTASGIRLINPEQQLTLDDDYTGIVNGLPEVQFDGSAIVNRIYPFGQAQEGEPFNLQRSTRSSPYTIQTEQGPIPRLVDCLLPLVSSPDGFETFFTAEGDNRYSLVYVAVDGGAASFGGQQLENLGIGLTVGGNPSVVYAGKPPKGNPSLKVDASFASASVAAVSSFKGVDQVNPIRDTSSSTGTGTGPSVTVTTEVGDYIFAWLNIRDVVLGTDPTITPGTGVSLLEEYSGGGFSTHQITAWTKTAAATSTTLSLTLGSSKTYDFYAVALKPQNLYYIEDSTSKTAYKLRSKVMTMNSYRPADPTDMVAAANTLYDRAINELTLSKDGVSAYNIEAAVLPTPTTWLPGDSMRLVYRGRARGSEQYLTKDQDLIVMERSRSFGADIPMTWDLALMNVYKFPSDITDVLYGNDERLSDLER